jgi:hypothetical protein
MMFSRANSQYVFLLKGAVVLLGSYWLGTWFDLYGRKIFFLVVFVIGVLGLIEVAGGRGRKDLAEVGREDNNLEFSYQGQGEMSSVGMMVAELLENSEDMSTEAIREWLDEFVVGQQDKKG